MVYEHEPAVKMRAGVRGQMKIAFSVADRRNSGDVRDSGGEGNPVELHALKAAETEPVHTYPAHLMSFTAPCVVVKPSGCR